MTDEKNNLDKREEEQAELDRRDAEWKAEYARKQREAYPEIYAEADRRAELLAVQEGLQDDAPRIVGLEPGHDPTLQASKQSERDAKALEEAGTAGGDNKPPHETTAAAATSTPVVAQTVVTEPQEPAKTEEKPKGSDKK